MKSETYVLSALTSLALQSLENQVTILTTLGLIVNKLGMPEELERITARLKASGETAVRVEEKMRIILEGLHGKNH